MKKIKEFLKKIDNNLDTICNTLALIFGFITQILIVVILLGLFHKVSQINYNENQQSSEPVQSERLALANDNNILENNNYYNVRLLSLSDINNLTSNNYYDINRRAINNNNAGEYTYVYQTSGLVISASDSLHNDLVSFTLKLKIVNGLSVQSSYVRLERLMFTYVDEQEQYIDLIVFNYDYEHDNFTFNNLVANYQFLIEDMQAPNIVDVISEHISGGLVYSLLDKTLGDMPKSIVLGLDNWLPVRYISQEYFYDNVYYGNTGSNIYLLRQFDLDFVSNGVLYDRITIIFNIAWYVADNTGNITQHDNNMYQVFDSMYYRVKGSTGSTGVRLSFISGQSAPNITLQGLNNLVCSSQVLKFDTISAGGVTTYEKVYMSQAPYLWSDETLKTLYFNDELLNVVPYPLTENTQNTYYTNKTWEEILLLGYSSGIAVNYTDNGGYGIGGVFTLIAQSFSGLMPLLNITIVPGITIGLLVFIPLIITIILVVIRLVKK